MRSYERRHIILRILCRRRYETIHNLATELNVSERTIRRDIDALSLIAPIYTQPGRYCGGVYVTDSFVMDRMYFRECETELLLKILRYIKAEDLTWFSAEEIAVLQNLIKEYTKPKKER